MNEALFEMLLDLFEATLLRLKEASKLQDEKVEGLETKASALFDSDKKRSELFRLWMVKEASGKAMRVFTPAEQLKLSKASYQLLMRLQKWEIISAEFMELVINLLLVSSANVVSLRETKWTIRALLADKLPASQLAYVELVLNYPEEMIIRH